MVPGETAARIRAAMKIAVIPIRIMSRAPIKRIDSVPNAPPLYYGAGRPKVTVGGTHRLSDAVIMT